MNSNEFFVFIVAILVFSRFVKGGVHNNELIPGYVEGDIIIVKSRDRTVLTLAGKWPNKIVPFVFDPAYTSSQKSLMLGYMDTIRTETKDCVRFVNRTNEAFYLYINSHTGGCSSYLGMQDKYIQPQHVFLAAPTCMNQRNVIHELLHSLGFIHGKS